MVSNTFKWVSSSYFGSCQCPNCGHVEPGKSADYANEHWKFCPVCGVLVVKSNDVLDKEEVE